MKKTPNCKMCGNIATITFVSRVGGFTKLDLCDSCAKQTERIWNQKGIQFKKHNIMAIDNS
jgi:protein-arginine kinase activator protein McsA